MSMRMLPALCTGLMLAACNSMPPNAITEQSDIASARPGIPSDQCAFDLVRVPDTATFETDTASLDAEAQRVLGMQAEWLKCYGPVSVLIEGHAGERGTREYNLALGERRAH